MHEGDKGEREGVGSKFLPSPPEKYLKHPPLYYIVLFLPTHHPFSSLLNPPFPPYSTPIFFLYSTPLFLSTIPIHHPPWGTVCMSRGKGAQQLLDSSWKFKKRKKYTSTIESIRGVLCKKIKILKVHGKTSF